MELIRKILNDVLVLKCPAFTDTRGDFLKIFSPQNDFLKSFEVKQVNLVKNPEPFTLRGLHYQEKEFSESKFFRVLSHSAQIVFVDLRLESSTYVQTSSLIIDKSTTGILIPKGFATGYITLNKDTDILYCSDNIYSPGNEKGIRWNDPKFKIIWANENSPILISDKDKMLPDWK